MKERRKKFPTKRRIQQKQAEQERRWLEARERERGATEATNKRSSLLKAEAEARKSVATSDAEIARKKREKALKKLRHQEKRLEKLKAEIAKSEGDASTKVAQVREKRALPSDDAGGTPPPKALKTEADDGPVVEIKQQPSPLQKDIGPEEDPVSAINNNGILTCPSVAEDSPAILQEVPETPSSPKIETSDNLSTTSSSSSSTSSSVSDSEPEEIPFRPSDPIRVPPPPRDPSVPVCRHFAQTGKCRVEAKTGRSCRWRHELPPGGAASLGGRDGKTNRPGKERNSGRQGKSKGRIGLYQRVR